MGITSILRKINRAMNNIDNPVKVDPHRYNDPIALKIEWSPIPSAGGANFCTSRLIQTDEYLVKFLPTLGARMFFISFILISILFPFMFMEALFEGRIQLLIIPILFMIVGIYGLVVLTVPAVFDKKAGVFYKGRRGAGWNDSKIQNKRCQLLDHVHAIQILSRFIRNQNSEGTDQNYYSFEINLVMKDGQRVNVVSHGNLSKIRADAHVLSDFLNCPLWDAAFSNR